MSETTDAGGVSLSPEENKFFETGGETAIPADTGAETTGGESSVTDGGESDGGDKSAGTDKQPVESKTVPLAALQEERTKRKADREAMRKLETELAEMRGRFSVLDRLGKEDKPADAGPPKPEDDIFGAVNAIQKQLADEARARTEAAKAEADRNTFMNHYRADAERFEKDTPDFREAYKFLLESRARELSVLPRFRNNPQALRDALIADEYGIAQSAFADNESAAEAIYKIASERGYKKAPAQDNKGAEKLERIEKGQQVSKSLNNAGGSSGEAAMTAERLLSLPMDEFEAWVEKNPAKARRIMGGP